MYSVLLILLQCLDLCFELVDEDEDLAPRVSGSDWLVVTRVTSDHCSVLRARLRPAEQSRRNAECERESTSAGAFQNHSGLSLNLLHSVVIQTKTLLINIPLATVSPVCSVMVIAGPLGHQPRGAPRSGQPQPGDPGGNILTEISLPKIVFKPI